MVNIDELITNMEDDTGAILGDRSVLLTASERELIVDALTYYKEVYI